MTTTKNTYRPGQKIEAQFGPSGWSPATYAAFRQGQHLIRTPKPDTVNCTACIEDRCPTHTDEVMPAHPDKIRPAEMGEGQRLFFALQGAIDEYYGR